MVKFSKQIEGQLVPEWRAAYVNYKSLKKDLKRIAQNVQERRVADINSRSFRMGSGRYSGNLGRVQGSLESFVALTGQALGAYKSSRRSRREFIQVHKLEGDPVVQEVYETRVVDATESEKLFFSRLDTQFNKVNSFYRSKEKDFVEHAEILEKQMQALVESQRSLVEHQQYQQLPSAPVDDESRTENSRHFELDSFPSLQTVDLEVGEVLSRSASQTAVAPDDDKSGETSEISRCSGGLSRQRGRSSASHLPMRMSIPTTTPGATISVISQTLWEDVLKQGNKQSMRLSPENQKGKAADEFTVTKKKVQLAEKMLREAFVEYYRGLSMLKSYSSLNMVAFAKILKKYDKVSGQRASATYLKAVEASYFNISDKIIKLMEKVETLFTTHFAHYNRQKAMMSLRPKQKRASHRITFALGLFSGGSLALLAVFAVLVHNLLPNYRPMGTDQEVGGKVYLDTVFPIFSAVALILLHIFMYGVDVYFWRRTRINYAFIFEFQPGTELRYREVLMVTSILTTVLMGVMVGQLALHTTNDSPYIDLLPFGLVTGMAILLFFPLNIFYRSSRVFFLNTLLHICGSPFYKVVLADFFLADQLTSQVPMLKNLQYVMCYYLGGIFISGNAEKCSGNNTFKAFVYLVSLLPYWWRLMQCVRRFIDESDKAHIANGGKYLSALIAVALRLQYGRDASNAWMGLYIVSSIIATFYQLYWDIVVDWGLLQKNSVNPWLRDRLIMPKKKYIYFFSMVLNLVLRLAWLQSVTRFRFGGLDQHLTDFVFAALEVIRRGHWNFYRLENEHLNNVGKYRATRTVPLPFEDPTTEDD